MLHSSKGGCDIVYTCCIICRNVYALFVVNIYDVSFPNFIFIVQKQFLLAVVSWHLKPQLTFNFHCLNISLTQHDYQTVTLNNVHVCSDYFFIKSLKMRSTSLKKMIHSNLFVKKKTLICFSPTLWHPQ